MIKKIKGFFILCTIHYSIAVHDIEVKAHKTAKLRVSLWYISSKSEIQIPLHMDIVKKDLLFLDQFNIFMYTAAKPLTKKERQQREAAGDCVAIFFLDDDAHVDLYVHDLLSDATVLSKRVAKKDHPRGIAHFIADLIVQALTGKVGFFSTRIAYCKEYLEANKHVIVKQLCVADYDGSHEEMIVEKPAMTFGIRWNNQNNEPLIFYSEHTKFNIRLMMVDLQGNKKIASDADGITMLPSFMPDGQGVIYCATAANGYSQLYYLKHNKIEQLTNNEGNNIAPSITPDGKMVYFCSDYLKDIPQIVVCDIKTCELTPVTHEGYCTSPVVCPQGLQVAYTKMVQGVMQLFIYCIATGVHKQLTFDEANKEGHSWSGCGTFLMYGANSQAIGQRILLLNTITGVKKYVTAADARCSSPAWSPKYNYFPIKMG
jgi:TolB protein